MALTAAPPQDSTGGTPSKAASAEEGRQGMEGEIQPERPLGGS